VNDLDSHGHLARDLMVCIDLEVEMGGHCRCPSIGNLLGHFLHLAS
jgi:hypothetical protein